MRNILFFVLLSLMASLCLAKTNSTLSQKIDKELNGFKHVSIGILIKDKKTGKILYQKNADRYFMPASTEKLFTALAALEYLGKDFTYQTQVFADSSKIQDHILNADVYFKFSGDPTFSIAQLEKLVQSLSAAGIQKINGKIIIDDSVFDQMSMSPGSAWDDQDFCWGAPIHAIVIENNCVRASIAPGKNVGELASMTLPDFPQAWQFKNNVMTSSNEAECRIKASRQGSKTYAINGCIKANTENKMIAMAIDNPRENLQLLLSYLLAKNKIMHQAQFEFKKIDVPPALLASESSPPLSILITSMLKDSDNTIANSLAKTIGSLYAKEAGSFENGADAMRKIINQSIQLNIPETTLVDPSGTSRYNFLTPRQIVTLLQKIHSTTHDTLFIAALPIAGVDGTLKKFKKESSAYGNVYAKTGSMTSVSTLAGYIRTKKNNTLIFTIMVNGFIDLPKPYQDLQEKICSIAVENA